MTKEGKIPCHADDRKHLIFLLAGNFQGLDILF